MKLSICIPTYNRSAHLTNCLQSIIYNKSNSKVLFQVCVSDNCSTDQTESVILSAQQHMKIKYRKNPRNLGIARNLLNVVQMADGEFVWIIGDDDLLLPGAIAELSALIDGIPDADYFYVNSYHLTAQYVLSFPQPFSLSNLPAKMTPFSSWPDSGRMKFMDLVDPRISFDFLMGMYLSVFRRKNWVANVDVIDDAAVSDSRLFSHFDNTCPHVKIFAKAFANSNVYFCSKPLSVCLTGAREWAPMYPLVRSVRMIEALNEYRNSGLPYFKYWKCRNYALGFFIPDLVYMLVNGERAGLGYIRPLRLVLANMLFPNFYLSVIYYFVRKLKRILSGGAFAFG